MDIGQAGFSGKRASAGRPAGPAGLHVFFVVVLAPGWWWDRLVGRHLLIPLICPAGRSVSRAACFVARVGARGPALVCVWLRTGVFCGDCC